VVNHLEVLAANLPRMQAELSAENRRYFGKDEELFTREETAEVITPPAPPSIPANPSVSAAPEEGKARIVVVRTPSSAAIPIPLAESTQETAA
jgi:hypothetical protein